MTRTPQNPTELRRLRRQLAAFHRVLPSLDLKRRQLAVQSALERDALRRERGEFERSVAEVAHRLPMLASASVSLEGLVIARRLHTGVEVFAGVGIPVFEALDLAVADYSRIGTPHWVDGFVEMLCAAATARARLSVRERRIAILGLALRGAMRRVNLLEKMLVPRTVAAIRGIEVFLADAKRAEVVRAKIAKSRHAASALSGNAP